MLRRRIRRCVFFIPVRFRLCLRMIRLIDGHILDQSLQFCGKLRDLEILLKDPYKQKSDQKQIGKVRSGCDMKRSCDREENLRKDTDDQKRERKQEPEYTVSDHHFGTADAGNNECEYQNSSDCDQYTYAI